MSNKFLSTAIKAAKKAGQLIMKYYGTKTKKRYKEDKSIVTEADLESEKLILNMIKKSFPNHAILSEEAGLQDSDSDFLWCIDPLDGTTNFSMKNPFFNVSIALLRNKEPILGVVYYPPQDELFHSELGKGAYLNDKTIKVSSKDSMKAAIFTFCNSRDEEARKRVGKIYAELKLTNNYVRQIGSAALELCMVASGRVESFFMIGVRSWDVAAGWIMVKEAGGTVTDFKGNTFIYDSKNLLATNGTKIHEDLLEIIRKY
ncbi:MAG: inositol monophosphatase [Candidatus Helarchaeota archaeon]|nr:inositol monophosphatase [Candidatus Helarchaeota archaeon]